MVVPTNEEKNSRLPGFYELPASERVRIAGYFGDLDRKEIDHLKNFNGIGCELTDVFIENAIGTYSLPMGVATNFMINDRDYLVPMVVEESSVLAAASHGAKLIRAGGGFRTEATEPVMTGQIQLFTKEVDTFDAKLTENKDALLAYANQGHDRLVKRGGGAKDITWHYIKDIASLVVHLHVDTRDAMGANIVNTMCERLSLVIAELIGANEIGLRILTNLTDRRIATAFGRVPAKAFASKGLSGEEVVNRIERAYLFAFHDVYRATTNNKGVMNGIDPVIIATGNDWRAVEAGAHAFACRSGRYLPLAKWWVDETGDLCGKLELPMAVGTVGGVTKLHPTAKIALKILSNPSGSELAQIVCCVGLAQNLAALRALATEGIQQGHMALHKKNLDLLNRQGATKR